jgi:hypothetical protein
MTDTNENTKNQMDIYTSHIPSIAIMVFLQWTYALWRYFQLNLYSFSVFSIFIRVFTLKTFYSYTYSYNCYYVFI